MNNENNTKLEVADYDNLIEAYPVDYDKLFGKKSKPRSEDPNMFELLSWQDSESLLDYKTNNRQLLKTNPFSTVKYSLAKSTNPFTSESRDAYRKFAYSPHKQNYIFSNDEDIKRTGYGFIKNKPINENIEKIVAQEISYQVYKPEKYFSPPKYKFLYYFRNDIRSIYHQEYDVHRIKDINDLKQKIDQNENKKVFKKELKKEEKKQIIPGKGFKLYFNYSKETVKDLLEIQGSDEEDFDIDERKEKIEESEQFDEEELSEEIDIKKTDYKNVESRLLTTFKKKMKKLDPKYEKERLERRKERIQKMKRTTKWMPNSTFFTYFGKPPFENYGMGNVNPTNGGSIYGNYLKSHNINPQRGINKPEFVQTYSNAMLYSQKFPPSEPEPPRIVQEDYRLNPKQIESVKSRNPLMPEKNNSPSRKIIKPDLINSVRFASNIETPEETPTEIKKAKLTQAEMLKKIEKEAKTIRSKGVKQSSKSVPKKKTMKTKTDKSHIHASELPKEKKEKLKKKGDNEEIENSYEKELARENYLKRLRQKIEKGKITKKVTEVHPVIIRDKQNKQPNENKENIINKEAFENIVEIDPYNPPKNYLSHLSQKELDPKNYKNIPNVWLNRIPFAGKIGEKSEPVKLIFESY